MVKPRAKNIHEKTATPPTAVVNRTAPKTLVRGLGPPTSSELPGFEGVIFVEEFWVEVVCDDGVVAEELVGAFGSVPSIKTGKNR